MMLRTMRRLVFFVLGLALTTAAVLHGADDRTGTWQGSLEAGGRTLRLVVNISNGDQGPRAVIYSIDQGGTPIPAAVTLGDGSIRLTVSGIGASYDARFSADGKSMQGTWTQGGGSMALTLERATPDTAWPVPANNALKPMAADADPAFEVATIKPSEPGTNGRGITMRGRQVVTFNTTFSNLMAFAYRLHPRQIVGAAAWANDDRYNILAQPDAAGMPSEPQIRTMLQKLLRDRFGLVFHKERQELAVYALTVPAGGQPKLTKNDTNPNGLPGLMFRGLGTLPVTNATMADFAAVMSSVVLDRPVVDETGLSGRFDFILRWTPDQSQFDGLGARVPTGPSTDPNAPPDLFTAIQEQLGLKFIPKRAPTDVVVIDKLQKPTPD